MPVELINARGLSDAAHGLTIGDSAKVEDWKVAVNADFVATSLDQAALICAREMRDASAVSIPIRRKAGIA
jgi:hypothetical protein